MPKCDAGEKMTNWTAVVKISKNWVEKEKKRENNLCKLYRLPTIRTAVCCDKLRIGSKSSL